MEPPGEELSADSRAAAVSGAELWGALLSALPGPAPPPPRGTAAPAIAPGGRVIVVPGRRFEQFRGGDEGSVVSVDLDNGICEVIFDGRPTSVPVAMRHLETPAAEPSEQSTTKDTADVTRRLLLPQPSEPSTTRDTARTVQDDVTTGSATLPAGSDDGSSMIGPASAMPRASRPSMPGPESAAGARAFVAAASATQPAEVAPAACGGGAAGLAAQAGWPDPADAFRLDGGLISQSLHGAPVGWLFVQRLAARLDALERRVHVLDGQADPGRSVAVAPGHRAAPQEAGDVAEGLEAGLGRLVTQTETSAALEQRLAELSSQVKAVVVQEASREARCQEFQEQLRLDMQAWCARMGSRGSWRFGAGRNWRPGAADADESMNTTNGMLEEDAEASMQLRDRCEVPSARAAAQAGGGGRPSSAPPGSRRAVPTPPAAAARGWQPPQVPSPACSLQTVAAPAAAAPWAAQPRLQAPLAPCSEGHVGGSSLVCGRQAQAQASKQRSMPQIPIAATDASCKAAASPECGSPRRTPRLSASLQRLGGPPAGVGPPVAGGKTPQAGGARTLSPPVSLLHGLLPSGAASPLPSSMAPPVGALPLAAALGPAAGAHAARGRGPGGLPAHGAAWATAPAGPMPPSVPQVFRVDALGVPPFGPALRAPPQPPQRRPSGSTQAPPTLVAAPAARRC